MYELFGGKTAERNSFVAGWKANTLSKRNGSEKAGEKGKKREIAKKKSSPQTVPSITIKSNNGDTEGVQRATGKPSGIASKVKPQRENQATSLNHACFFP